MLSPSLSPSAPPALPPTLALYPKTNSPHLASEHEKFTEYPFPRLHVRVITFLHKLRQ